MGKPAAPVSGKSRYEIFAPIETSSVEARTMLGAAAAGKSWRPKFHPDVRSFNLFLVREFAQ